MKRLRLGLLTLGLLLPVAPALAQTEEIQDALIGGPVKLSREPLAAVRVDYRDYVFLASDRPVLLRLHVHLNGVPYFVACDAFLQKWVRHFDRDGNGVLSKAELERVPNAAFLQVHLRGAIGRRLRGQTLRLAEVDANKDGKVTLEELIAHYQRTGLSPLRFSTGSNQAHVDGITDALFKQLDANSDGKLSPQELGKAPDMLQRLDRDEDELLTEAELTAASPASYPAAGAVLPPAMAPTRSATGLVLEITEDTAPAAAALLAHYDRDRNKKLSRQEVGLEPTVFDRLDSNRDGQLDAKEVAGFFRREADLEMMMRVGKLHAQESVAGVLLRSAGDAFGTKALQLPRTEVFSPRPRSMPLVKRLHTVDSAAVWLPLGNARVEMLASDQGTLRINNVRRFYKQQFEPMFDKKDYVERKQLQGLDYLDSFFTLADRNGDDRMSRAEMAAYLKLLDQGSSSFVTLTARDHGCSLFELLDTNADGRLSVRELRDAWKALRPLAKGPDAFARADIPRRVHLDVTPGGIEERRVVGVRTPDRKTTPPLWFRKMDRNNDGDLSPTEFLGTEEDFRRLDTDGDGLISSAEASRAGKR